MRAALEVTAHETVFVHCDVEGSSAGVFDCCSSVFLHQGKHAQDAADAGLSLPVVQQLAELASLSAGMCSPPQELRRAERHFLWVIFFLDAVSAALLTQMFAQELVVLGGPAFLSPFKVRQLDGREIAKVVVVPGRLVNIVTRS